MNITEAQNERIEITLNRAIEQKKINRKEDANIEINNQGNVWLSWKNTNRSFRFTIFADGQIYSGFFWNKRIEAMKESFLGQNRIEII